MKRSAPARRIPVVATVIVLCAVATMIGLGVWQLGRAEERDRQRAAMSKRPAMAVISFPFNAPTDSAFAYRAVEATCARVTGWQVFAGKGADAQTGWAHVARCQSTDGVPFKVNAGISPRPDQMVTWSGGEVSGFAVAEPDVRSIWDKVRRADVTRPLMIVSREPAPGLIAARAPSPLDEVNTSWAYAVQWFFFAATALIIYVIALRRRTRDRASQPTA